MAGDLKQVLYSKDSGQAMSSLDYHSGNRMAQGVVNERPWGVHNEELP